MTDKSELVETDGDDGIDVLFDSLRDLLGRRGYSFHKRESGDWYFKKDDQDWSQGTSKFDTEGAMLFDCVKNLLRRRENTIRKLKERLHEAA